MSELLNQAKALAPEIVRWRRHIHENPEVSAVLPNTCAYVTAELRKMGYEPYPVGGGVVAMLDGQPDGKVILLRADMDALPMAEESGEPFASKNPHAAHTCGHDTHTAMLLGAAKLLMDNKEKVKGRVKFMFQPGEEGYNGCKNMIADGLLESPHVDVAFGMHSASASDYKTGTVLYSTGSYAASADAFKVTVHGKGCHGARPEEGIDPINIITHIHLALQTINSREVSPNQMIVLTVCAVHAGTAANVTPADAVFKGTIRTMDMEVKAFARRRFTEICEGVCKTFRATCDIDFIGEGIPPMINDNALAEEIGGYIDDMLGEGPTYHIERMTGSEDFSVFSPHVPCALFWFGTGSTEEGYAYGVHDTRVTFNEDAIPMMAAVYAEAAIRWLREHH